MGVAYWMFPRTQRGPQPPDRLGWAVYALLNVGLAARVVAEPASLVDPGTPLRWLLPVSAACQLAAVVGFTVGIWPRVRGR